MHDRESFAKLARRPAPSLLSEVWQFLAHRQKWWLLPVVLVLLLLGALMALSGSSVGPLVIYTLF